MTCSDCEPKIDRAAMLPSLVTTRSQVKDGRSVRPRPSMRATVCGDSWTEKRAIGPVAPWTAAGRVESR